MVLSEYCRNKIGDFLKDIVDVKEGYTYESQIVIEQSIRMLIKTGTYTLDGLRKKYPERMFSASPTGMDV